MGGAGQKHLVTQQQGHVLFIGQHPPEDGGFVSIFQGGVGAESQVADARLGVIAPQPGLGRGGDRQQQEGEQQGQQSFQFHLGPFSSRG